MNNNDNNFILPIKDDDIKNILKYYLNNAKGAGRNRKSKNQKLTYL